jgi:hypothetical protein
MRRFDPVSWRNASVGSHYEGWNRETDEATAVRGGQWPTLNYEPGSHAAGETGTERLGGKGANCLSTTRHPPQR